MRSADAAGPGIGDREGQSSADGVRI
jgi:hypothetical protein